MLSSKKSKLSPEMRKIFQSDATSDEKMQSLEEHLFGQDASKRMAKFYQRLRGRLMVRIYAGVLIAFISSILLVLNPIGQLFPYLMFAVACIALISVELAYGSKRKAAIRNGRTNLSLGQESLDKLKRSYERIGSLIEFLVAAEVIVIVITIITDGYESTLFPLAGGSMALIILPVCRRKVIEEKIALSEIAK